MREEKAPDPVKVNTPIKHFLVKKGLCLSCGREECDGRSPLVCQCTSYADMAIQDSMAVGGRL
jgi:hypothetical protein